MEYFFSVYLGRVNDPGIICSVAREAGDKRPEYSINRHSWDQQLTNDPLGTVSTVKDIIGQYTLDSNHIVVDITNVGIPFVDLFKDQGLSPTVISTTNRAFIDKRGEILLVPRRDLLMNLFIMKNRLNVTYPRVSHEFLNQLTEKLPQVIRGLDTAKSEARPDTEVNTDYVYYGFAEALWLAEKGMNGAPKTQ